MFGTEMNSAASAGNDRVTVSLKALINMAKPAKGLSFKHFSISSRHSGNYLSRFKGRGMEFDEARFYQLGDDIRTIDWRVTARTGETHTKVFREERERPVFISVDNRPTMHFATRGVFKSVLAAKLAGLLAWVAESHGDKIGGQVFSEKNCFELKPQNGKRGVLKFFNALVKSYGPMESAVSFDHALARLTQHVRPGSLVYIISDFRGINNQAETHLAKLSQHCQVVLIFVFDALESSLPSKGRYRFTYEEREVIIDTSDRQRLSKYQQLFAERRQRIDLLAKKLGLALIECNTTEDPVHILKHPLGQK
jgi:uncharacterized protein (DUF58 family)